MVLGLTLTGTSYAAKSLTKKESKEFVLNYAITLKDERKDGVVTYIFGEENYERYKDFKAITKDAWRFSKLGALRLFNNDIKMTWKIKLGEVNEINIKTKFDPIGKLYEFTYQPKQEFLASVKKYEEDKIAKKELEKQKEIAKQKKLEEEKKRLEEERLEFEEQKKAEKEKKRLEEERLESEEIKKIASSKLKKLDNYDKSNEQLLNKVQEVSMQLLEFKDSKEINLDEGYKLYNEYKLALEKQKSQAIAEAAEVPYVETPIDSTIHRPLKNYVAAGERKIKKYQAEREKKQRLAEKAEKKRIAEEKRKRSDELDKELKEALELSKKMVKKLKESKKREKKAKNKLEKKQKKRFKDIWTKIAYNYDNGDTLYVDFKNIKIEGDFIYYWSLMDHGKPKDGKLSIKHFSKLDCNMYAERPLQFMYYTGNKATGTLLDSQKSLIREYYPIPPDTPLYDSVKKLCKNI